MEDIETKRKQTIEVTFSEMGIRAKNRIAEHLLVENAFDNNLITDITNVDYTEGNLGKVHLQPLEDIPIFCDDAYLYTYLSREDVVFGKMGKVQCTTGEKGASEDIVGRFLNAARQTIGKDNNIHMHTFIVLTLSIPTNQDVGIMRNTVSKIEENKKIKEKWIKYHNGKEPVALVVAKIDFSTVSIETIEDKLPEFEARLFSMGAFLFSLDYTQDFSGTLKREDLVKYLCEEKDFTISSEANWEDKVIIDNTCSVGDNVLIYTWNRKGLVFRTKLYNKIVGNLEAGEVRTNLGGNIADYVHSSNAHLRKVFQHPDVKARGCTRLEVTVYGTNFLSKEAGNGLISETLQLFTPVTPLFFIQPATKQWENLREKIDRCFVLVDRLWKKIYFGWYANTKTRGP